MNEQLARIRSAHRGASFFRADLHVHSFGGEASRDVDDKTMTPAAIVAKAIEKNIGVIAITDHNRIGNVRAALAAADGCPILVVPGVELTTPGGHLLVYAPSIDALERIIGRLEFDRDRENCRSSVYDVLTATREFDGLAIAAHIDLKAGLETAISGYGDAKRSLITSPTLVALEIANRANLNWYSDDDADEQRRVLFRARMNALSDSFVGIFPKIQSSDAHALAALGRNYEQTEKLTRLKMAQLDWPSFRRAFADPEARIRLEEEVPNTVPHFVGMHLEGGFLPEQSFAFSKNLTCIIGGRGSGKSTAFEALRCAAGHDLGDQERSNSDCWPTRVDLLFMDEWGEESHIVLDEFGDRHDQTGRAAPTITLTSLGQGDMARQLRLCGTDPDSLLGLMNELIDIRELHQEAEVARGKLVEAARQLDILEEEIASLTPVTTDLQFKLRQRDHLQKEKGEELIALQRQLAASVLLRRELLPTFDATVRKINAGLSDENVADLEELAARAAQLTGVTNAIPNVVEQLRSVQATARETLKAHARVVRADLDRFVDEAQAEQQRLADKLKARSDVLREKGLPVDLKALSALEQEIVLLQKRAAVLARKKSEVDAALKAWRQLYATYRERKQKIFATREGFARTLSSQLNDTLFEMEVKLRFREAGSSQATEALLKSVMEWRTAAVPKAGALVRNLGVSKLIDAIVRGDLEALTTVPKAQPVLSRQEARELVERMSKPSMLRRLQTVEFEDAPRLHVQKTEPSGGAPVRKPIEFSKLSLGQQQAVILSLMLCGETTGPLLIDQPEDNLDSAFVFKVLVRALRRIKERRQVIVVTHNANIGVLADSDLVIPLKATSARGTIVSPGSVETPATRDLVYEILEGGSLAYRRRGELYGMR